MDCATTLRFATFPFSDPGVCDLSAKVDLDFDPSSRSLLTTIPIEFRQSQSPLTTAYRLVSAYILHHGQLSIYQLVRRPRRTGHQASRAVDLGPGGSLAVR
jgi:hypothetical protein